MTPDLPAESPAADNVHAWPSRPIAWVDGRKIREPWWWLQRSFWITVGATAFLGCYLLQRLAIGGNSSMLEHAAFFVGEITIFALGLTFYTFVVWGGTRPKHVAFDSPATNQQMIDHRAQLLLKLNGGIARHLPWKRMTATDAARLSRLFEEAGLPRNLTIIDKRYRPKIETIEIQRDLVEMESLRASTDVETVALWLFAILVGFLVQWAVAAGVQPIKVALVAVGFVAIWIAMLRLMSSYNFAPGVGYYVGPGFISDKRGRVWTTADSIVYVKRSQLYRQTQLVIEVVGPAGRISSTSGGPTDPQFVAFWQRWQHPHPRLDLIEDAPAKIEQPR